jgi:hypothetical protein
MQCPPRGSRQLPSHVIRIPSPHTTYGSSLSPVDDRILIVSPTFQGLTPYPTVESLTIPSMSLVPSRSTLPFFFDHDPTPCHSDRDICPLRVLQSRLRHFLLPDHSRKSPPPTLRQPCKGHHPPIGDVDQCGWLRILHLAGRSFV